MAVWKQDLHRGHYVKKKVIRMALIQYDRCPYKKEKFGQILTDQTTWEDMGEGHGGKTVIYTKGRVRRRCSQDLRGTSPVTPDLGPTASRTEVTRFCCSSCQPAALGDGVHGGYRGL